MSIKSQFHTSFVLSLCVLAASTLSCNAQDAHPRVAGAEPAASAFGHSNPMYAVCFGSLAEFLEERGKEFGANSPAVKCLYEMAAAFRATSFALLDPGDSARQAELNSRLGSIGVPSKNESTPSADYAAIAMQLERLARGLPTV